MAVSAPVGGVNKSTGPQRWGVDVLVGYESDNKAYQVSKVHLRKCRRRVLLNSFEIFCV